MGTDEVLRQGVNILGDTFDGQAFHVEKTAILLVFIFCRNELSEGCNGMYLESGGLVRRMEVMDLSRSAQY